MAITNYEIKRLYNAQGEPVDVKTRGDAVHIESDAFPSNDLESILQEIITNSITQDSPKAKQPPHINMPLRPHQLAETKQYAGRCP